MCGADPVIVLGALAGSRAGEGLLFVPAVAAVAGMVGFTVTSFEVTVRACVAGVVEVGVVVSEVTWAATPLVLALGSSMDMRPAVSSAGSVCKCTV